jgi:hypothetical protein
MALTDAKVRALKGRGTNYKVSDGEGLYVLVSPNGSKLWRLAYGHLGKRKTLALGKYPHVSLLDARRARDDAKRQLAKGTDASNTRKLEKREKLWGAGNTFEAVANEWFETQKERWVASYSVRLRSRLDCDLLPRLSRLY